MRKMKIMKKSKKKYKNNCKLNDIDNFSYLDTINEIRLVYLKK